jgi:precorrin-6A/cobalt-precorrin-6A reductase
MAVGMSKRLLVLGGTGDAAQLIRQAALIPDLTIVASLAGRTPKPNIPSVGTVRIGGFGGVTGLTQFLQDERIDLIIDATHPFAAQISHNAAAAAIACGIPRLLLNRPGWTKVDGDRWISVANHQAAAAVLPALGQSLNGPPRIFLTIGRQELAAFAPLTDCWFLMRMITPPEVPIPPGEVILQQGPFSVEQEIALIEKHNINVIVSKNSGGNATYAKIEAARRLNLPIVIIPRPVLPAGNVVASIDAAIEWLQATLLLD